MYTFIYMYVFMAMSVCVCVCTLCVCVFVYVLVRRDMCVRLFVCVCLRPCACVCARTNACQMFTYPVFVCVRVYRYVCKSIRMYMYMQLPRFSPLGSCIREYGSFTILFDMGLHCVSVCLFLFSLPRPLGSQCLGLFRFQCFSLRVLSLM